MVGAVIAATAGLLLNLRDRDLVESKRDLSRLTLILAEQIDQNFRSIELIQTTIIDQMQGLGISSAEDFERQMSSYDIHKSLKEQISALPYVNAIVLTNADGKLINFSRSWPIPNIIVPDRDPSKGFNADPHLTTFVGEPLRSPFTGNWVIPVARKFSGTDGKSLGVVIGVIEAQYLEHYFKAITPMAGDSIALFRRDGTLLIRYPRADAVIGRPLHHGGLFANLRPKFETATIQQIGAVDGEDRLISARSLAHYPIVVVATTAVAEALANWRRAAVTMTGAALMIGLLIGGIVVFCVWNVGKTLREKNIRLDTAINNVSQGIAMFDRERRLIVCNTRYADVYSIPSELTKPGTSQKEILKHRIANGTYAGSDPQQYLNDRLVIAGDGKRKSSLLDLSNGRFLYVCNQPTEDGGWVSTHEDVTEKIRAEKINEQQKVQLDTALENMRQGLLMCDASGRVILTNQKYLKMYGLSPNAVKTDWTIRDVLHQRKVAGTLAGDPDEYLAKRIDHGNVETKVVQIPDGRTISVTNAPVPGGGWVSTHEDISEGIRREESFRLLFEHNPVPMWVIDRESLRFLSVNDATITHYGYSREQFMAMTVLDLRPAEDREHFVQSLQTESNDELVKKTLRHLKADGTIIEVCAYSQALVYAGHNARLAAIHDITQAKHAEEELLRTKIFLDTIIEHVPVPVIVKEVTGLGADAYANRFTLFNRAYEELTGESRYQLIGKTAHQLFPMERADLIVRADNETLQCEQAVTTSEHPIITCHNGTRLVIAKKTVIRDETGKPTYLVTVVDDVTEQRRAEQRIAHMAHHDTLTNLPNRAAFSDTMDAMIDHARASGEQVAILSIDLDHFKEANDTYGHLVGDALLREVSSRLQGAAEGAFLARIGGDEFTLIVAGGEQPTAAEALTKRLLAAFVEDFKVEGHQLKLGLSIGVAIYPTDGEDANSLMANADAALYRAKAEFRGSAQFYEAQMGVRLRERNAMQEDLRSAIDRGELLVHYQPQMKMSGETIGFEALVRWQCPKRGLVSPGTFIPIAEESSLIIPVGEWVLREACREAASWPQPLTIAVNISPIQFHNGDLPRLVHSILLETGLAPGRLELEVTENVMISDFSRAVSILNQLKSLGVRIAMDDFGTGYSSLSYLQSFRCDKIKIDRIFIRDLETSHHSRAIVRAVIGLGQSLNLPILAEGVETEAQHVRLVREGCDEVQGYLTGRPLPIAQYANLVGWQAAVMKKFVVAR